MRWWWVLLIFVVVAGAIAAAWYYTRSKSTAADRAQAQKVFGGVASKAVGSCADNPAACSGDNTLSDIGKGIATGLAALGAFL